MKHGIVQDRLGLPATSARRALVLWFPHLGAEGAMRAARLPVAAPLAVVEEVRGAQVIVSLDERARRAGLMVGRPLRDALASCSGLVTRPRDVRAEAALLAALARWAGRFTPWVAIWREAGTSDALALDVTGCAHLWGGEANLAHALVDGCGAMAVTACAGLADTPGAAWALARMGDAAARTGGASAVHAGRTHRAGLVPRGGSPSYPDHGAGLNGDSIDQEAPATRARAHRRPRVASRPDGPGVLIAPPGGAAAAIAPLPVAALRLDPETATRLGRLGLRRVEDLMAMPRTGLVRRFGRRLAKRLDQALGAEPEPISPAAPPPRLSVRLAFPDPIGLEDDVLAALDRLLPALSERLEARGLGARRLRLDALLSDGGRQTVEVGLARPSSDPERIRPLLAMKLGEIDAGFGIDALRIEATAIGEGAAHARTAEGPGGLRWLQGRHEGGETLPPGPSSPPRSASGKQGGLEPPDSARRGDGRRTWADGTAHAARDLLADLIGRIGARLGLEAIQRAHPAASHIPEKGHQLLLVAWSEPGDWPRLRTGDRTGPPPRPLLLWRPELVTEMGEGAARNEAPRIERGNHAESPDASKGGSDVRDLGSTAGAADTAPCDREGPGDERSRTGGGTSTEGGPASGSAPPNPPARFRWRGRMHETAAISGVERIAPEWWFDDPEWRTGIRDYRRVTTRGGEALWLFHAHGGRASAGWFCHGAFA